MKGRKFLVGCNLILEVSANEDPDIVCDVANHEVDKFFVYDHITHIVKTQMSNMLIDGPPTLHTCLDYTVPTVNIISIKEITKPDGI